MAKVPDTGQPALQSELASMFDTMQEERGALVRAVRDLQLNARMLVLAEARRLKAQRDPADARVTRYERGGNAILRRVAALEVEAQIADIRVPPVPRTGTLVQGRVTDEASRAIAHLSVTLVDDTGQPVAAVPPVETDDAGYYAFVLAAAQTEAIGPDRRLTLQVGSSGGKLLVPAAAAPLTLTPGKMIVADMPLQGSELEALHLRPAFPAVQATAAPTAEAAKTAGKPSQDTNQDAKPRNDP